MVVLWVDCPYLWNYPC